MFNCDDHNIIVDALAEVDADHYSDTILAVKEVAADLKEDGLQDLWVWFIGKCRICNHVENIIAPAINDLDNQECGNCGYMTMQEREIPEWEQDG